MITTAETAELIALVQQGDSEAGNRMITENTGLIWSVARRFFGRGVEADDLFQLGCLGFIKAVQAFDPSYGTRFSTYAVPKIAGEIRRFLRDDGSIKVSRTLKEQAATISKARASLSQKTSSEPTLSELSRETGLSAAEIAMAESANSPVQSLQYEVGADGFTLETILGIEGIEDGIIEKLSIRDAVASLPDKERKVISLRYYRHLTQDQTAKILKVSQVQISRIERKALESLRKIFIADK